MDKEYKIIFTCDFEHEYCDKKGREYWQPIVKKLKNTKIKLSEVPDLVEKYGDCIVSSDEIEIYNYYRE